MEVKAKRDQEEIFDHAFGPVNGFFEKFFKYESRVASLIPACLNTYNHENYNHGPGSNPTKEDIFLLKMRFIRPTDGHNMFHLGIKGSLDIMTLEPNHLRRNSRHDRWSNVQGLGYFRPLSMSAIRNTQHRYHDIREGFRELYNTAWKVFMAQPSRLFLHCFYIYGDEIEPWLLDRTGLYSCQKFKISDERIDVLIRSYTMMSEKELGINLCFDWSIDGDFALFGKDKDCLGLRISGAPIIKARTIVDTKTPLCFPASLGLPNERKLMAIKMKWKSSKKRKEESLMDLAAHRHVKGVTRLYFRYTQATMAKLHCDLGIATAPSRWRTVKGVRGATLDMELRAIAVGPLGRALGDYHTETEFFLALKDAINAHKSLYFQGGILHRDVSYGNIILTSGSGMDEDYDGIKYGALIDLDNAIEIQDIPETNRTGQVICTHMFAAIGVLEGDVHTYRHDLESFFYIFLWQATIGRGFPIPLRQKFLSRWMDCSSHRERASMRSSDILSQDLFDVIVGQFQPEFKEFSHIAYQWRDLLFFPSEPSGAFCDRQKFCKGQLEENGKLYEDMTAVIDKTMKIIEISQEKPNEGLYRRG